MGDAWSEESEIAIFKSNMFQMNEFSNGLLLVFRFSSYVPLSFPADFPAEPEAPADAAVAMLRHVLALRIGLGPVKPGSTMGRSFGKDMKS